TDGMDFVGRLVRRRELPRAQGIKLLPPRQLPRANLIETRRIIFLLKKDRELSIRRHHMFANRRLGRAPQPLLVRGLNFVRKLFGSLVEQTRHWLVRGLCS